jgi:hypothetical protein
MKIYYDILKNLLKFNNGMTLEFREKTNTLDILLYKKVILTIELPSNSIEENSELIYNSIIQLADIQMYIPKIYIKEN